MADANMYVLNPVFKADTFQETVAPLTLYAQAYKEQEAKIEDMTDKAAALEWIANQNPESQTAALYRDMSNKIKGLRDDIMTNGLMGGLRSRILGARRTYSANSAEIARRYEDMKKYQERMEQMYDKDNSMVFSPESTNVTIDSFAGGNRPKIKAVSGNEIVARGAAVGKRLTSQIFGDGVEGTVAGEQFWKFYKENGMTDEALAAALDNIGQSDKYSMVKKVIDGVYSSFADFDQESQNILKNRFIEGVYDGAVYNRDVSYQANQDHLTPKDRHDMWIDDQQNARSQAKHDAEMKDWSFNRGDTSRYIYQLDEQGNPQKVKIWIDPTQGQNGQYVIRPVDGGQTTTTPVTTTKTSSSSKQTDVSTKIANDGSLAINSKGEAKKPSTSLGKPVAEDSNYTVLSGTDMNEYADVVRAFAKAYGKDPSIMVKQYLFYKKKTKTKGAESDYIACPITKTDQSTEGPRNYVEKPTDANTIDVTTLFPN